MFEFTESGSCYGHLLCASLIGHIAPCLCNSFNADNYEFSMVFAAAVAGAIYGSQSAALINWLSRTLSLSIRGNLSLRVRYGAGNFCVR